MPTKNRFLVQPVLYELAQVKLANERLLYLFLKLYALRYFTRKSIDKEPGRIWESQHSNLQKLYNDVLQQQQNKRAHNVSANQSV